MDPDPHYEVIRMIQALSYRKGNFTLSSGKKSSFYIDLKATTLHPEGAHWIGELAFKVLSNQKMKIEGVGGLTLGADPLATAISLAAWSRKVVWPAFIVRKEPKSHGTTEYVEGKSNLKPGASLIVLEDVVTTGGSSLKAIRRLRVEGFHPVAVLAIVDRQEGGEEVILKEGVGFLVLTTLREISQAH